MNRRTFLVVSSAVAVVPKLVGCDAGGANVEILSQDFNLQLSNFPDLATPGRTVMVNAGMHFPLAVTMQGAGDFIVTGTECTHAGCAIRLQGDGFTCPCHGSQFALDGTVERGPASDPLPIYDYELNGDVLTIKAP